MSLLAIAALLNCSNGPPGEDTLCENATDCDADDYCERSDCDAVGFCVNRPAGCGTPQPPVCGCDGQTYAGVCEAHRAGTDVDHDGAC